MQTDLPTQFSQNQAHCQKGAEEAWEDQQVLVVIVMLGMLIYVSLKKKFRYGAIWLFEYEHNSIGRYLSTKFLKKNLKLGQVVSSNNGQYTIQTEKTSQRAVFYKPTCPTAKSFFQIFNLHLGIFYIGM